MASSAVSAASGPNTGWTTTEPTRAAFAQKESTCALGSSAAAVSRRIEFAVSMTRVMCESCASTLRNRARRVFSDVLALSAALPSQADDASTAASALSNERSAF